MSLFVWSIFIVFISSVFWSLQLDSFHNDGKELSKDFTAKDDLSTSNAINLSVFDDIVRLNNISLQIIKRKDRKYNFLVYDDANSLKKLEEGDMLLDLRDKIIQHKFIARQSYHGRFSHNANNVSRMSEEPTKQPIQQQQPQELQQQQQPGESQPLGGQQQSKQTPESQKQTTDNLTQSQNNQQQQQSMNSPAAQTPENNQQFSASNSQQTPSATSQVGTPTSTESSQETQGGGDRSPSSNDQQGGELSPDYAPDNMELPEIVTLPTKKFPTFRYRQPVKGDAKQPSLDEHEHHHGNHLRDNVNVILNSIDVTPYGRKLWVTQVIPYEITHTGTNRWPIGKITKKIHQIMDYFEHKTCIRFRERKSTDRNWINIFKGTSCYAELGRKFWMKSDTKMSIGDWCVKDGIIKHLFMHTLGFFHETTRPDRGSFIDVLYDRIIEGQTKNFKRHSQYDFTLQQTPYDYRSIMHFGTVSFSTTKRKRTLRSSFDSNEPMGGNTLTKYDIQKINKMYHCYMNGSSEEDGLSTWTDWSVACLEIVNQGCSKIRQQVCLGEDLSKCPGVDKYGVKDQFWKCKPERCTEEFLLPHWGAWSEPSVCSKSCGVGMTTQKRKCNNPPPIRNHRCHGNPFKTTTCSLRKCTPDPFDTDFEKDLGHWKVNFQYNMFWERRANRSLRNTGPKHDHTTGNGYYAVLSAKHEFKENNKLGELISMEMNTPDNDKCIVFYYLMNGASINALRFYLRVNNKHFLVWERGGHQGNHWQRGAFSIPKSNVSYFVVLSGKTGLAATSDLAVDDIQLNDGVCPIGIEGCHDFYAECQQWKKEGRCFTHFTTVVLSCCKSCEGLDFSSLLL